MYIVCSIYLLCNFQLQIVSALLEAGASPNDSSDEGITPLMLCQSVEAAEMLLEYGADLEVCLRI